MAKRAKVAVAASSRADAESVGRALAGIGCLLKIAAPGADFLRTARQWQPDLIVVGAGGTRPVPAGLLRLLRGDTRTRRVPILALLGARPSARAWAQAGHADDVVRRPLRPEELAMRVRTLLRLSKLTRDTRRKLKRIQAQARIDNLTGLATHGAFKDRIVRELPRAERYQRPLSLLMADVDHFKHYNDSFGHPAGDRLLRVVGRMVAGQVRQVDFGARYGGDEFAIILPETSKTAARSVAERLRIAVEAHPFSRSQSQPLGKVTVSVGVATFPDDATTPEKLLEVADRALYQAKAAGRNLVRSAGDAAPHDAGGER